MKKILGLILILSLTISTCFIGASALEGDEVVVDDTTTETPTDNTEITDTKLEDTFEYYVRLVASYVVSFGGTASALLLILKKILGIFKEVKEGTKSIEEAKNELELQKEELLKQKDEFVAYTETFKNAILDEDRLNDLGDKVDKITKIFSEIACNDSKMVSNGTALKIQQILEGNDENV